MTREERIEKLRHLITCMKCEVSGKPCDNNCPTQYDAGHMGEIIENLEEIAKALEQEPCEDWYDVPSDEMTLEQARQAVKDLRKMWAERLEQEPCEDTISRQAVLDGLARIAKAKAKSDAQKALMGRVMFFTEQLPPITPQPKIGRWISHREHCENLGVMPSGLGAYEWCSNCDCGIDVMEWHRSHYNYCPNCGAEMESEVEE